MKFKNGDRVKGLRFEFKDEEGTVYEQVNDKIVLVDFDNYPIRVATTVSNLVLIKEDENNGCKIRFYDLRRV